MVEKALIGTKRYYLWLFALLVLIGVGTGCYLYQLANGLGVTGMNRDVTWGFYIAQFTFLVGVAAGGVMVVLPYYLHHYKKFGTITIFGEFLAIGAIIMCQLFIFVDLGQPMRVLNVMLHPTPNSVMFWDMVVLVGYLILNVVIGFTVLSSERKEVAPPKWVKPLIYLSIPWAISIHTVTAFLYSGLPGRHFWLTAIMAPRFLASAFAAGPALLIVLLFIIKKTTKFDPGKEAFQTLAKIVTYAMIANVFFYLLEFFTAFYSQIPGHMEAIQYLWFGYHGHADLVPFMWLSATLGIGAIVVLLVPTWRQNPSLLLIASIGIFVAAWIDKGLGLVVGGFFPNPLAQPTFYSPTAVELGVTFGVFAIGALVITVLYKIAIGVKEEKLV